MITKTRIRRKQFELTVNAVTNGVYYSAYPDNKEAIQELTVEDLQKLPEDKKEQYMKLREFGKDLYFTYPKGTTVEEIIMEYVYSIFELMKTGEDDESI
jgi:hypothetical protein